MSIVSPSASLGCATLSIVYSGQPGSARNMNSVDVIVDTGVKAGETDPDFFKKAYFYGLLNNITAVNQDAAADHDIVVRVKDFGFRTNCISASTYEDAYACTIFEVQLGIFTLVDGVPTFSTILAKWNEIATVDNVLKFDCHDLPPVFIPSGSSLGVLVGFQKLNNGETYSRHVSFFASTHVVYDESV